MLKYYFWLLEFEFMFEFICLNPFSKISNLSFSPFPLPSLSFVSAHQPKFAGGPCTPPCSPQLTGPAFPSGPEQPACAASTLPRCQVGPGGYPRPPTGPRAIAETDRNRSCTCALPLALGPRVKAAPVPIKDVATAPRNPFL
jgi:hypothetical protein